MIAAPADAAASVTARWSAAPRHEAVTIGIGSFGAAMANVDGGRTLSAVNDLAAAPTGASAFGALARQLDEIGRQRIEARALSAALAEGGAAGMNTETLAVTMHRQVRAMANYNMSVMWAAKLVGVTAGALRQLTASS